MARTLRFEQSDESGRVSVFGDFTERADGLDVTIQLGGPVQDRIIALSVSLARPTQDGAITAERLHGLADELSKLATDAMSALTGNIDHRRRSVLSADQRKDEVVQASRVYLQAVEANEPPVQAVMDALTVSRATAARRIREAKDLGLIRSEGESK